MTIVVDRLDPPGQEVRDAIRAGPTTLDAFHAAFASLRCLDQIECAPPPPAPPRGSLESARIAFWNAEELKYLPPSTALLRRSGADAFLLCEIDLGMARSGNRHTMADVARGLNAGYAYAVEFVELGLGDAREQKWHAGERNTTGLHGAGLVSARPLERPELVRLEKSGRWFDGAFGEPRVGSRIAVMAELALGNATVLLVSVHYESHTGPSDRLAQTRTLLDAIDRRAPRMPALIGGDFNTSTFERPIRSDANAVAAALRENPSRLALPMQYEPMFEELRTRGYEWENCNVIGATTQRTRPDGTPLPPFGRIDWFFARGLQCGDAAVIPAVDAAGAAISDHDALAVTIRVGGG